MSQDTVDRLAWSDFGSCNTADPDLFFPRPGTDTSYARSICRSCPVRRQCLDYALETGQKHGIWGGMTENQRRRLRRPMPSSVAAVTAETDVVDPALVDAVLVDAAVVDAAVVDRPVRHLRLVHSS